MTHIEELLARYKSRGVLIDTNLLLLYFVGLYDQSQIQKFKRTLIFTVDDFDIIRNFINYFGKVVTTPNILTEVSNLSGQLPDAVRSAYYDDFTARFEVLEEEYVPSADICSLSYFRKYGLTDSGIASLVRDKYLVLTDDFRLSNFLQSSKIDVINFNHLRFRI